ncbi:unnamed protein product [Trichobilharzia regenti]|nr:unnamed protein product [Trichobilharzia regenti]
MQKSEKKNLKKLYKYKSQSVSRLSELGDIRTSVISLDDNNSPSMQNAPIIENANSRMPTVPLSTGSSQNFNNAGNTTNNSNTKSEAKKSNSRLALRKHLSKSEYTLNSKNSGKNKNSNSKDSNRIDHDIMQQIRNELEERFQCCTLDSKNSVAQMEWKCLLERQELRRAHKQEKVGHEINNPTNMIMQPVKLKSKKVNLPLGAQRMKMKIPTLE